MENQKELIPTSLVSGEYTKRFIGHIRSVVIVEVYKRIKDLITQKEFARRMGMDEAQFSKELSGNKFKKKTA